MAKVGVSMNGGTISSSKTISMPPPRTAAGGILRGSAGTGRNNPLSKIVSASAGKNGGTRC